MLVYEVKWSLKDERERLEKDGEMWRGRLDVVEQISKAVHLLCVCGLDSLWSPDQITTLLYPDVAAKADFDALPVSFSPPPARSGLVNPRHKLESENEQPS